LENGDSVDNTLIAQIGETKFPRVFDSVILHEMLGAIGNNLKAEAKIDGIYGVKQQ
jgi:hypothetical protein